MSDELVKRLRDGVVPQSCDECERDSVVFVRCGRGTCKAERELMAKAADAISALSAQQSQEPVGWHDLDYEVSWGKKMPPIPGTWKPIYTAPSSGVREGMLRAAEICKEWEGKLSQGAGYAIRTAREAITSAADQVNAEGQESIVEVKKGSVLHGNTPDPSAPHSASQPEAIYRCRMCGAKHNLIPRSQPDTVAVPELIINGVSQQQSRAIVDEMWGSVYWTDNKCYPAEGVTVEYRPAILRAQEAK